MYDSRINNKWPVAKEGLPFILLGCAITLLLLLFDFYVASVFAGGFTLFIIFFFRDPQRGDTIPQRAILTPADGRILEVKRIGDRNNPLGEPAIKVSIFMSIFDVHVNRIPVSGVVSDINYHPGRFFSANLDKASEENEKNVIVLKTPDSRKIVLIQIAGLIARRIACWIRKGDHVNAGQRLGLIRFGSRVEVYLVKESRIAVKPGDKVRAGETILGYLL